MPGLIDCHPNLDNCPRWLRASKKSQSGRNPISWLKEQRTKNEEPREEERKKKKSRRRRRGRIAMGLLVHEWVLSLSFFHFLSLDLRSVFLMESFPCKRWQLMSMGSKSSHSGFFGNNTMLDVFVFVTWFWHMMFSFRRQNSAKIFIKIGHILSLDFICTRLQKDNKLYGRYWVSLGSAPRWETGHDLSLVVSWG